MIFVCVGSVGKETQGAVKRTWPKEWHGNYFFFTTFIPKLMILKSKHFIQFSEIYTELVLACGNVNDVQ